MSAHIAHVYYLLCDGRTESGRCTASYVHDVHDDPYAPGAVLVTQFTAVHESERHGWQSHPIDGPHYCPRHKPTTQP